MDKEEVIKLIKGRIEDEYRKHPLLDWARIAAGKIYTQWFEYFNNENKDMIKEIKKFIGTAKHDEFKGTYIWGVGKDGGHQMIAELRGWGAIQNMFKNKDGSINFEDAEQFQDELGKFIVEAINEKINKT